MSKEKSPAFQFYAAEYLADENVQLMTMEEEGCYCRLMAYCWREGSIPSDLDLLTRLCKSVTPSVLVLKCFKQGAENARLIHTRLEIERQKQAEWKEKSALGGKRSAHKRKHPRNIDTQQAGSTTVPRVVQPKGNSSSSSSFASSNTTTTPISPQGGNGNGGPDLFARFYSAYPRKENPQGAKKAFSKLKLSEAQVDGILRWIEQAKLSDQWQDASKIPFPTTFLNQQRWLGDPPPPPAESHGPPQQSMYQQLFPARKQ